LKAEIKVKRVTLKAEVVKIHQEAKEAIDKVAKFYQDAREYLRRRYGR
jgi:hypothetical protein